MQVLAGHPLMHHGPGSYLAGAVRLPLGLGAVSAAVDDVYDYDALSSFSRGIRMHTPDDNADQPLTPGQENFIKNRCQLRTVDPDFTCLNHGIDER